MVKKCKKPLGYWHTQFGRCNSATVGTKSWKSLKLNLGRLTFFFWSKMSSQRIWRILGQSPPISASQLLLLCF